MLFLSTEERAVKDPLVCPLSLALADEIFLRSLLQSGFGYLYAALRNFHSFRQFVEEAHAKALRKSFENRKPAMHKDTKYLNPGQAFNSTSQHKLWRITWTLLNLWFNYRGHNCCFLCGPCTDLAADEPVMDRLNRQ